MKNPKLTRRELAGAMLAVTAAAQSPAPQSATPATPDEELKAAREQNQHAGEALAKVEIPMESEPAFHFTA
ncbi:MAG: hypothetical protein ACLP59_22570 [Bryobacteraceae bacterium]